MSKQSEGPLTMSDYEMATDLSNTRKDIVRLRHIVQNLREFIHDTGGENREGFRRDLFKYETLLSHAANLEEAIQGKINDRLSELSKGEGL